MYRWPRLGCPQPVGPPWPFLAASPRGHSGKHCPRSPLPVLTRPPRPYPAFLRAPNQEDHLLPTRQAGGFLPMGEQGSPPDRGKAAP